jgi:hypothetical protein
MLYAKYKYCTEATHQVRNGQSRSQADTRECGVQLWIPIRKKTAIWTILKMVNQEAKFQEISCH